MVLNIKLHGEVVKIVKVYANLDYNYSPTLQKAAHAYYLTFSFVALVCI